MHCDHTSMQMAGNWLWEQATGVKRILERISSTFFFNISSLSSHPPFCITVTHSWVHPTYLCFDWHAWLQAGRRNFLHWPITFLFSTVCPSPSTPSQLAYSHLHLLWNKRRYRIWIMPMISSKLIPGKDWALRWYHYVLGFWGILTCWQLSLLNVLKRRAVVTEWVVKSEGCSKAGNSYFSYELELIIEAPLSPPPTEDNSAIIKKNYPNGLEGGSSA